MPLIRALRSWRSRRPELALLRVTLMGVSARSYAELAVLLECHDEQELERALSFGIAVIGINNRDLDSLQVDRSVVRRLLPRVPLDRIVVAESGYETPGQLHELRGCCDAALVGTVR